MDIERLALTRRKMLGLSGAGLSAGGAMTLGWYQPALLPDFATDWLVNYTEEPPSPRSLWKPTVTRDHAETLVSLYADVQDEALALAEKAGPDAIPFGLPSGWRDDASEALENENYSEAVRHVEYGLQFEGEALGKLRVNLDEVQLESLAERSADILDRIEAVQADISSYPVEKPERDLAWYTKIELQLQRGRSRAQWSGFEEVLAAGETSELSAEEPMMVGSVTRQVLLAEVSVVNAERFRDRLTERLGSTRSYEPHLRSENDRLEEQLQGLPTQKDVRDTYVGDTAEHGPYEFAHARLARWLFPTTVQPPWLASIDEAFLVSQALGKARGLVDWRAHETVLERMDIEPDDEGFDPADVLEAKRTGNDTYERVIRPDPSPFLSVLAEQGIGNLRVVDIDREWAGDWSPWQERVQAYLYALLGAARLETYPPLYDRLVAG